MAKIMTKKLMAVALALAMCFSLTCTALAASSSSTVGSIKITGAIEKETYTIYQIFELSYSSDADGEATGAYIYKVCGGWKDFLVTQTVEVEGEDKPLFTLTDDGYLDPQSLIFDYTSDSTEMADLARAALAWAQDSSHGITGTSVSYTYDDGIATVTPEGIATVTDVKTNDNGYVVGNLTFTNLALGYYLVDTSLGGLCMLTSTDPDATVKEKNGIPTLSKWVHENTAADDQWGHEDDASNKDHVLFELVVSNINGSYNLVLHDSMDDELVIEDKSNFHMNSVYLYTSEGAEPIELQEGSFDETTQTWSGDYYITQGKCTVDSCTLTDCAFEIHFLRNFDDVDDTGYIQLTYSLLLATEGDTYVEDYEEIDNYAALTFATYSMSPIVMAETYSFGFEIYKYGTTAGTEGTSSQTTPLADAEFAVKNSSGQTAYFLKETLDDDKVIYLFEGWLSEGGTVPDGYTTTLVSASDGMIYVEGFDTGTYTVTETKAPDGYNLLTDTATVEIWAQYDPDTGEMTDHGVRWSVGNTGGTGNVNIENNAGSVLPTTGGIGTTIFYIVGGVLVAGAAVVLITRRRVSHES